MSLLASKPFQKRFGRLFSHPISLLAIATVFATLAGVWLTNYYQEQAWVREKQFETFRQGYREALELVDELSDIMSRRFFGLNRVMWVAKGTGTGTLEETWATYYESVEEWNTKIMSYQGRLARFVDPDMAEALGSWEDAQATDPRTIHGRFFQAHERVRVLVDCARNRCAGETKATALQQAQQAVNGLGLAIQRFVETCTASIHEHASWS